ncbi:Protein disulfide isomerase (prolyl 4-hydroxylase beta subunit) [Phaffia rhodozyma]|uniref:Protein disulfide-isomerase n=1 Tax=Phaffia rhodozyma TaxID=264483 RepID=A0A0F7SSP2_PHARH|nr:Protein disulfide isomerase (prolyl 4-hydroxylase beta subunit) [Phaffia rhodozyma]
MKLSSSLGLLALAAAATASAASDVLDLTAATFDTEITDFEGLALAEFFAPWCGHCKALAPHYEEAATELKSKNIKLAKIDCTVEADLCQEFGIQGYPTLKVFNNGQESDYTGPRKADGIVSYMIKQSLPAITEVTASNHDEFKGSDKIVVISYGSDAAPKEFASFANANRDAFLFGHSSDLSLASLSEPSIILYKTFDEPKLVLSSAEFESLRVESLGAWVKSNSVPLLGEIAPENFASYAEAGLPIAYVFVNPEAAKENAALVKTLEPVAKEYKGKLSFVTIDAVKFIDHAKSLNLDVDNIPGFVIQDLQGQTKFPLKLSSGEKLEAKVVEDFVARQQSGDIKPDVKSAPIPAEQVGNVYELVSDEYEEVVWKKGADKDVFIELFAPWCGHCKKLKPIWDTLADKYAEVPTVLIAAFDATENDLPPSEPFKLTGFPTLKFKPAGSSEYVDYQGDRSLESLIEFVQEHSQSDLTAKVGGSKNETPLAQEAEDVVLDKTTGEDRSVHDEL